MGGAKHWLAVFWGGHCVCPPRHSESRHVGGHPPPPLPCLALPPDGLGQTGRPFVLYGAMPGRRALSRGTAPPSIFTHTLLPTSTQSPSIKAAPARALRQGKKSSPIGLPDEMECFRLAPNRRWLPSATAGGYPPQPPPAKPPHTRQLPPTTARRPSSLSLRGGQGGGGQKPGPSRTAPAPAVLPAPWESRSLTQPPPRRERGQGRRTWHHNDRERGGCVGARRVRHPVVVLLRRAGDPEQAVQLPIDHRRGHGVRLIPVQPEQTRPAQSTCGRRATGQGTAPPLTNPHPRAAPYTGHGVPLPAGGGGYGYLCSSA